MLLISFPDESLKSCRALPMPETPEIFFEKAVANQATRIVNLPDIDETVLQILQIDDLQTIEL